MFLVTGGAGFIGSNVVASLNEAGANDIVVNDLLGHDDAQMAQSRQAPGGRSGAAGRIDADGSTAANSTPSFTWARFPTPPPPTATW